MEVRLHEELLKEAVAKVETFVKGEEDAWVIVRDQVCIEGEEDDEEAAVDSSGKLTGEGLIDCKEEGKSDGQLDEAGDEPGPTKAFVVKFGRVKVIDEEHIGPPEAVCAGLNGLVNVSVPVRPSKAPWGKGDRIPENQKVEGGKPHKLLKDEEETLLESDTLAVGLVVKKGEG
jgi:hypothetical protein